MTSPMFVVYLTCLFLGEMAQMTNLKLSTSVHQESGFVSVKTRDSFTLQCFYEGDMAARFYWYKQSLGQKPRLVSAYYKYESNGTFYNEFKNNPRFSLDTKIGQNHLKIKDLQISDSAAYFCASSHSYMFEFGVGIFISVKSSDSNISALVHQSASESIQPGGSVTLNCTVHTGSCDGGHRVYWFKQSEEPHPGLIYTHEDGNDQCERKPDTQIHTCVYNLPMENLNLSHAGTYYCAVASCGHVLFGNGTKLDIEDEGESLVFVYLLSGAVAFTTILNLLLLFSLCLINKRHSRKCAESHARVSALSSTNAEVDQNEENIHYAALKEHKVSRSRRQRNNTEAECVYSPIKQ